MDEGENQNKDSLQEPLNDEIKKEDTSEVKKEENPDDNNNLIKENNEENPDSKTNNEIKDENNNENKIETEIDLDNNNNDELLYSNTACSKSSLLRSKVMVEKEDEDESLEAIIKRVETFNRTSIEGNKNLEFLEQKLIEKEEEEEPKQEDDKGEVLNKDTTLKTFISEEENDEEEDDDTNNNENSGADKRPNSFSNEKYSGPINADSIIKINNLREKTEAEVSQTIKNFHKTKNIVKKLVSKNKTRFCYDGFDLDLTYITSRIIAMGLPSVSIEGIYRNKMEDVQEFFNTRHKNHYKVYNLCDDKTYPAKTFYEQACYPFKDHEAPPLNLIRPFCEDCKKFLDEDPKNVVAIHCKAGKGRTGTFICCLLMYLNTFETADESLKYYGIMRVENGKGVTVPSQRRYIHYFEMVLKNNMPHPIKFVKKCIKNIKMITVPMFHKAYSPLFTIENLGLIIKYSEFDKNKNRTETDEGPVLDFCLGDSGLYVIGDVKIEFYRTHLLGKKEKIFKFWFNTNFVGTDNNIFIFKKGIIDKACKDKKNKYYKENFRIEIHFKS